jgi:hypothetical protein
MSENHLCLTCQKPTNPIHSREWDKRGINWDIIPSWGCPQECEDGHITIRDGR